MEMSCGRFFMCTQFLTFILLFTIFPEKSLPLQHCPPSSCGNLTISHPFRLTTDPIECGDKNYVLSCETNNYTVIYLPIDPKYSTAYSPLYSSYSIEYKDKYYVEAINYNNYTIRVVDPNYVHYKDNCSSTPLYAPIGEYYFVSDFVYNTYLEKKIRFEPTKYSWDGAEFKNIQQLTETAIFLTCEKPVKNSSSLYKHIDSGACVNNSALSQSKTQLYSYVIFDDGNLKLSDLEESCQMDQVASSSNKAKNLNSYRDVHDELVRGFELSWVQSFLGKKEGLCYVDKNFKVHCLSECYRSSPTTAACGEYLRTRVWSKFDSIIIF